MELKPVRTDDQQPGRGVTYESTHDLAATESGRRVLRNTYLLLAASPQQRYLAVETLAP